MNLSPINLCQNPLTMSRKVINNKPTYFLASNDSFEKQAPTFKGNLQTAKNQILNNPDLLKKCAEFLVAGFASLAGLKIVSDNMGLTKEDEQETQRLVDEFTELVGGEIQPQETTDKLNTENAALKQRIQELEKELDEKGKELSDKNYQIALMTSQQQNINTEDFGITRVEFPKKRGRLTAEQNELKQTVLLMPPISKDNAMDLSDIIYFLINSTPDEKEAKKQQIIELNNSLKEAATNQKTINDVIKHFKDIYNQETAESNSLEDNAENEETDKTIYRTEVPTLAGPKILGTIDLSRTQNLKPQTELDDSTKIHKLTIPGTIRSLDQCIRVLLKKTIDTVRNEEDVKFVSLYRKTPVYSPVKEDAVINEIEKQERKGSPYKHLSMENVDKITELLSTGKFSKLFCIHSAMRLIDRYVDFNSDIPVENQCDIIISKLEKAIKESCKKGLAFKPYSGPFKEYIKDENGNTVDIKEKTFYSTKIFIDTSELSEDIQDVLGTLRIDLTIAEPNSYFRELTNKGIIVTLFSQGA